MNFKEWIALKENNSPGFAVNRTSPLSRDYRSNPYSFSYGTASPDSNDYWGRKSIELPVNIAGQAAGQFGNAFANALRAYGGNPTFGANLRGDEPSVWNWAKDKAFPVEKEEDEHSKTYIIRTRFDIPGNKPVDSATIDKAVQGAKNKLIADLWGMGASNLDPKSATAVYRKFLDKNNMEIKFRVNKISS